MGIRSAKEKYNEIVKIFHMKDHHGSKILKTPSGALPDEERRRRPWDNRHQENAATP
jgi:hypothetical protein